MVLYYVSNENLRWFCACNDLSCVYWLVPFYDIPIFSKVINYVTLFFLFFGLLLCTGTIVVLCVFPLADLHWSIIWELLECCFFFLKLKLWLLLLYIFLEASLTTATIPRNSFTTNIATKRIINPKIPIKPQHFSHLTTFALISYIVDESAL